MRVSRIMRPFERANSGGRHHRDLQPHGRAKPALYGFNFLIGQARLSKRIRAMALPLRKSSPQRSSGHASSAAAGFR
jgi:hypothetical protein